MQPVLPTSLDMVSANVLGFDAQAYIYDSPSTLSSRLNIPNNYNSGDCFSKKETRNNSSGVKLDLGTVLASSLSAIGFGVLLATLCRKKIKMSNLNSVSVRKFSTISKSLSDKFYGYYKKTSGFVNTAFVSTANTLKNFADKLSKSVKNIFKK